MSGKIISYTFLGLLFSMRIAAAQDVTITFAGRAYNNDSLLTNFGGRKHLLKGYELPILLALSRYPELERVKIKFALKKGGSSLTSKIHFWGLLQRPKKRTYMIHVRTRGNEKLNPMLFRNMDLDAQVGGMGHELAHTSDFLKRGFGGMLNVATGNLSSKYLDHQEFSTDERAINHGLGFQLFHWRLIASKVFHREQDSEGLNKKSVTTERYMRPDTILYHMRSSKIYESYLAQIESIEFESKSQ